jgi:hypothetical protein
MGYKKLHRAEYERWWFRWSQNICKAELLLPNGNEYRCDLMEGHSDEHFSREGHIAWDDGVEDEAEAGE